MGIGSYACVRKWGMKTGGSSLQQAQKCMALDMVSLWLILHITELKAKKLIRYACLSRPVLRFERNQNCDSAFITNVRLEI